MTESKQKAEELKVEYWHLLNNEQLAIKCAIICVEELIKDHEQDHTDSKYYFWQEVLTHLKEML